jgi:P2 family phage contractile tail tube protein
MAVSVNKMTNANVYIDGVNHLGKAEEIDLPKVTHIMAEHNALGMVGQVEFFAGVEKMESRIKWTSVYADVLTKHSNPTTPVQLMCRSSLQTWGPGGIESEVPYVAYMTGYFKDVPLGNFKTRENAEFEGMMHVTAVKIEIDGVAKIEFDAMSNTYKVDGVDILDQYKANIGA